MRFAPCRDGGMLGSRNAVGGAVERILRREIGGIKLVEKLNGRKRVRAEKIDEMRGAANGCGFFGGNAAKSEVVQLEGKKRRIAGADKRFADDLLDGARQRGNGDGIPDLDEKRLRPIGEPVEFRIGVFDGDERVVSLNDGAFLHRADAERQPSAVFGIKRFEALVVERLGMAGEVRVSDAAGILDVIEREDLSREIRLDDVLQHGEHGLFKHPAARFEIGIDVPRIRRILPPVGELVRVRIEDGVQAQRLHGAPRGCNTTTVVPPTAQRPVGNGGGWPCQRHNRVRVQSRRLADRKWEFGFLALGSRRRAAQCEERQAL